MKKEILKKQFLAIDLTKVVLSLFVVQIHCFNLLPASASPRFHSSLYDFCRILFSQGICRLAVPTFFLISGYLFFRNLEVWNNQIYWEKVRKRWFSLLLPYIVWNLAAFMSLMFQEYVADIARGGSWQNFYSHLISIWTQYGGVRMLYDSGDTVHGTVSILGYMVSGAGPINGPLWYIRDLIVLIVFSPVIYFFVRYARYLWLLFSGILMVLNIGLPYTFVTVVGVFFFSLGSFLAINKFSLWECEKKMRAFLGGMTIFSLAGMVVCYGYDEMVYIIFRNLYTLFGCLLVIPILGYIIKIRNFKSSKISFVAHASFFIYVSHYCIFLPISYQIVKLLLPFSTSFFLCLKYFAAGGITVMMSLGVYWSFNKWLTSPLKKILLGR